MKLQHVNKWQLSSSCDSFVSPDTTKGQTIQEHKPSMVRTLNLPLKQNNLVHSWFLLMQESRYPYNLQSIGLLCISAVDFYLICPFCITSQLYIFISWILNCHNCVRIEFLSGTTKVLSWKKYIWIHIIFSC